MNKKNKTLIIVFSVIVLSFSWLALFLALILSMTHVNSFYPRTYISGINIGGKTKEEAKKIVKENNKKYINGTSLSLSYGNKKIDLPINQLEPSFKVESSIKEVFKQSHNNYLLSPFIALKSLFLSRRWNQKIIIKNEGVLAEKFNELLLEDQIKPENAKLEIIDGSIYFEEASLGQGFDREEAKKEITKEISELKSNQVALKNGNISPQINDVDLAQAYFLAASLIQNKGFAITKQGQNIYSVNSTDLLNWMKFEQQTYTLNEGQSEGKIAGVSTSKEDGHGVLFLPLLLKEEDKLEATIDQERVREFADSIREEYEIEAENATLTISGGKVAILKNGKYGQKLDIEKLLFEINENIRTASGTDIELPIEKITPEIRSDNYQNLGIKELVAKGESNFSGSSTNRIHNLKLGASKFNNHIISPDQVVSFAEVIKSVEASDGYLPELVIKGKQTIQEYGGGMCQVSTTLYRAALLSGMPIVERRSHAYLVGYYKDGPDATVYVPSTDLKFKNDTGHHILVQTYAVGKKLIFEFWGTNPGRKVTLSAPNFFDSVPAPTEPNYIDDPSYPEGYEKMEEHPHEGISSIITRHIKYDNGKIDEESIKSVYKPWPAKIRRGIGPKDLPVPEEQ